LQKAFAIRFATASRKNISNRRSVCYFVRLGLCPVKIKPTPVVPKLPLRFLSAYSGASWKRLIRGVLWTMYADDCRLSLGISGTVRMKPVLREGTPRFTVTV
jgi:hypothetical protein